MTTRKKSIRLSMVFLPLLFPLVLVLLYKNTSSYLGDSDRYYHFALSKLLAEKSAFSLATLPQAENLGWGNYFPDKEFLFHAATRLGFSLGGEFGVVAVSLAFAAGLGVVLFVFALEFLPVPLAFFCTFSLFITHSLVFRLLLVRPHVAALFFFALLNLALLRRRPLLLLIASSGFVLSYHAFYLPLVCFALAFLLSQREPVKERAVWLRLIGFGIAGTAIGLLVNPYFPSQLALGFMHAKIPFLIASGAKGYNFGMELYPISSIGMLKFYYLPFAVLLLAAWRFKPSFTHAYLFILTLFFGLLTFQTVRAGEYFVLLTAMLFAVTAAVAPDGRKVLVKRAVMAVALLQLATLAYIARTEARFVADSDLHENLKKAVSAVPAGEAKIFNCEWDTSPYILVQRPDLRFIDLLDPSFLLAAAPELAQAKRSLIVGRRSDPFHLVGQVFRSDLVLCRDKALSAQLASDPHFQQLFPRSGGSPVHLFRRAKGMSTAFVRKLDVAPVSPVSLAEAKAFQPSNSKKFQPVLLPEGAISLEHVDLPNGAFTCWAAKVAESEVRRLSGARFLGIGGGQAIRAWRNGKLLFASGPAYSRARSVQALVPLLPALTSGERVDFLVCSSGDAPWISLAVSFWDDKAAKAVCDWKRHFLDPDHRARSDSAFSSDQESCLGTMASPAVAPELRP